jgi:hypothetical protein
MAEREETPEQYLARMLQVQVPDSQLMQDMPGTNTVTGYFDSWTQIGKNGMTTLQRPEIVTVSTKAGKPMYRVNASVVLSKITRGDRVVQDTDGSYRVKCDVTYEEKNKAEIEAYIKKHELVDLYDPVSGELFNEIWVPFWPSNHVTVTIWHYQKSDADKYMALEPSTGLPKIRTTVPVTLSKCTAQVYLKMSENIKKEGEDRWSLNRYPSFKCGAMEPVPGGKASQSLVDMYHQTCSKDAIQLVPMLEVHSGISPPPSMVVMWVDQSGHFTAGQVHRISIDEVGTDGYKNKLFRNKLPVISLSIKEVQPETKKTYIATFTGWREICEKTGLDCKPNADETSCPFTAIMAAHHFSGYIIGSYDKVRTMQYPGNNQQELLGKGPNDPDGIYSFRITDLVIDWKDTLIHRGIEISQECFIKTFREANANKKGEECRFKESLLADGTREYFIKSTQRGDDYNNPVTINGADSEVIPCGSGESPTISIRDFGPILQRPNARFFALTSVYAKADDPTKTESGDRLFSYQLSTIQGLQYSLFIVQATSDSENKKRID